MIYLCKSVWKKPLSKRSQAFSSSRRSSMSGWFQLNGVQCQICQVSSHLLCSRNLKGCKYVSENSFTDFFYHQWQEVYLPIDSKCIRCGTLCGSAYEIKSLKCLWCQLTIHQKCCEFADKICNPPNYAILPAFVQLNPLRIKKLSPKTTPVVVIINPKSGGQVGPMALRAFYSMLNPIQVINIYQGGLEKLKGFQGVKNLRILAAGGDGTVSRLLSFLYDESGWEQEIPPIGIFPLGTGNDLSYTLNWGKGMSSRESKNFESMKEVSKNALRSISSAYSTYLDRWQATITTSKINKSQIVCNYLGLGVDAKIAYDFDSLRKSKPYLFQSRSGNKLIYSQLGGKELFNRMCRNFSNRLSIKCDGVRVKLPYLEGIVFLNIESYGGGVDMWGDPELLSESSASESMTSKQNETSWKKQFRNDNLMELIGLTSVLHLGECQIGLSQAIKLAQGRSFVIEIRGRDRIPIQIDGEPEILKGPLTLDITRKDQVNMLSRTTEKIHRVARKVQDVLNWAEETKILDANQKMLLLQEFSRKSRI